MRAKQKWIAVILLVALSAVGMLTTMHAQPADIQTPYGLGSGELYTANSQWKLLRTVATATLNTVTTDLAATDMSWITKCVNEATIDATSGMIDVWDELGWGVNAVQIAFFTTATDIATDNFDIELYVWADSPYAPAQVVYLTTGDACLVGTMDCQKHPTTGTTQTAGLWIDTISGTDCWPAGVTVGDSGNNRICTMTFDLMGCRYLYVRCWNDSTGGTETVSLGAIIRKY